jgi:hypothetical protein
MLVLFHAIRDLATPRGLDCRTYEALQLRSGRCLAECAVAVPGGHSRRSCLHHAAGVLW